MSDEPVISIVSPAYRAETTQPRAELRWAARSMVIHPEPSYLYFTRDGCITRSADAAAAAQRRYGAILQLLDQTRNGGAPWVEAELARLGKEPSRAP